MSARNLAAYVLAAGRGRRMGLPKALLPHHDEPLLVSVARRYHEHGVRGVVGLVDAATRATLRESAGEDASEQPPGEAFEEIGLELVVDVDPEAPMIDSVRAAFRHALASGTALFFLQPVDTGPPEPRVLDALLTGIGTAVVAKPCHRGRGGHPLLLRRDALREMDWEHADDLRQALRSLDATRLRRIEVDEASVLRNWNRPEDLPGGSGDARKSDGEP